MKDSRLPHAPPAPASQPGSLDGYVEFLKNSLLKNAVVHHSVIPGRSRRLAQALRRFPAAVADILRAAEVTTLYSHQAEGIASALNGDNVVISTPTASGKTLVYNVPVIAALLENPDAHALYIFPLKALEQDQHDELRTLMERLDRGLSVDIYDGDTPAARRRKIRDAPPNVLITTPDMLHAGLLAYHEAWAPFLEQLRYVVIDELHTYSGVFGTHILHLLRRLNRLCAAYGSSPAYMASSATIGNPEQLAGVLANRPFYTVSENGAPASARHLVFVNPPESPQALAARLLKTCVSSGLRTIAFTRARVMTELIYRSATQRNPELRQVISSYRAGYLPEERRQIEDALYAGDLLGVVSTSALELGIDIGNLDVCILVGYPGSIVNTWQRAGRVGRGGREALIILIAGRDALDQYLIKCPEHFLGSRVEDAVVDPANEHILKEHLACAAREMPLSRDDPEYVLPGWQPAVDDLVRDGVLLQSADGETWHAARRQPHRRVSLRSIGTSWALYDPRAGAPIGTVSGGQVYRECHDGAVYLHRGRQYLITGRDPTKGQIFVEAVEVPYYTRAKTEKETEILHTLRSRPLPGFLSKLGRLRVRSQVVGYEKVRVRDGAVISEHELESPVEVLETVGFWLELEPPYQQDLKRRAFHPMGSIHAIEHAMKSLYPLLALSNRTDVGGICYPLHPQLGKGAIFVYDYYPGGIGLAEKGFKMLDRLLDMALSLVETCDCERGCPSCIHFPTCGAGNVPLDKGGCIHLLQRLTGREYIDPGGQLLMEQADEAPIFAAWEVPEPAAEAAPPEGPHLVVFDLETQRSAAEVGGWNRAYLMGMSLAVVWDSRQQTHITYREEDVETLLSHLQKADLVIGFNVVGFDYSVLRGYTTFDFSKLNTLDILRDVHAQLGYRLSLDSLGAATLGTPKSADGLQALQWYKEGRMDLIEAYCRHDVEITRDLWLHGQAHGHLLFDRKGEGRLRVPVDWDIEELVRRANRSSGK